MFLSVSECVTTVEGETVLSTARHSAPSCWKMMHHPDHSISETNVDWHPTVPTGTPLIFGAGTQASDQMLAPCPRKLLCSLLLVRPPS